jgi:hypothetical protein
MKKVRFSEILVSTYESTRRHNLEQHNLHRHEKLKFQYVSLSVRPKVINKSCSEALELSDRTDMKPSVLQL